MIFLESNQFTQLIFDNSMLFMCKNFVIHLLLVSIL
jgi:hypothetical protein